MFVTYYVDAGVVKVHARACTHTHTHTHTHTKSKQTLHKIRVDVDPLVEGGLCRVQTMMLTLICYHHSQKQKTTKNIVIEENLEIKN